MRGRRRAHRVWGMSDEVARALAAYDAARAPGHSGMGTTLSANPLQFACHARHLSEVMTEGKLCHMENWPARLEKGLREGRSTAWAPWHVVRVGARVEFICAPGPLRNGAEAEAAHQPELEAAIHRAGQPGLPDRAVPQHDADQPRHEAAQVDRLIAAFDEC
jgi:glutamate-1-semialdehyde 2,1-aminomutase